MNIQLPKIRLYPDKLDFTLYLGLIVWIAIIEALEAGGSWDAYLFSAGALVTSQIPVLLFAWKKEEWKRNHTAYTYRKYRMICFWIYLPLLAVASSLLLDAKTKLWELELMGAVCSACLELLLVANTFFAKWLSSATWARKLSLEKAIFISITLLALMLGAMAVSSLDDPRYHLGQRFLIGFEFDPAKILSRFGTFLSYSAQLLLMYLCGYFFFLINSRILVGKVLKEKGMFLYLLSCLATVGIFYPAMAQVLSSLPLGIELGGVFSQNPFVWENAFGAIIILLISLPVLLATQWTRQNTMIVTLEKEKAHAELDLLKQQLNPHFFFNTLNNLYALSLQRSQETPEVILQLSDLMRYVIYKAKEPSVNILDEVQYLRDYVQLQSIRLKERLDFRFETDVADTTFEIAPLLLIVLIENAFKHGIEPAGGIASLNITLRTAHSKLQFTCENPFVSKGEKDAGIGLDNLRKRLNLLYPNAHRLRISTPNCIFKVELELDKI